jgi:acyl carrier protein
VTSTESELRDLVAELAELDPAELDLDTPFVEVGIDSLLAMEIVVHVEGRFGVRFEESDVKHVRTLGQLLAMVAARTDA